MKSGCFTVVDRGRGFALTQQERALAAGGELRSGSNIGKGQIRVADYFITPDIVSDNNHSDGGSIGAILGSIVPGFGGVIASQISLSSKSADVTLAVTDTRSSEQMVMAEGQASKTDLGFGAGGAGIFADTGGLDFGAVGASSYKNTALGQVVALAYLDAYAKMVSQVEARLPANAAEASPPASDRSDTHAVAMARAGHLFRGPSVKSGAIRELPPGTVLYQMGKKKGGWMPVKDKAGQTGYVWAKLLGK